MAAKFATAAFIALTAIAMPDAGLAQTPDVMPLPEVEFKVPPKVFEQARSKGFRWRSAVQLPNPLCAANPNQRFVWFEAFGVAGAPAPTGCWRLDMECRKDGSMVLAKKTALDASGYPSWIVKSPRQK